MLRGYNDELINYSWPEQMCHINWPAVIRVSVNKAGHNYICLVLIKGNGLI